MKNYPLSSALILLLSIFSFAQSGKKQPTTASSQNSPLPYSESQPVRKNNTFSQTVNTQSPQSKNTTPTAKQNGDDDGEVLKVETNLVTIPVSVVDDKGLYVSNLQQSNFKIFENGTEQEVGYFGTSEKPFTVILMLDTSPSTVFKIEQIQHAAASFINRLKPQDNVMIVSFARSVHVLSEATNDRAKTVKAIQKTKFGTGTSLYDAVFNSFSKHLDKIQGRKAIVLFTDGVDTSSSNIDAAGTLSEAEQSDTLIFPIYFNTYEDNHSPAALIAAGDLDPSGISAAEYEFGRKYLEDLAAYTGGRVFTADSTVTGLEDAFTGIAEELRKQYTVGYYPNDAGETGDVRQLKVRIDRPNLLIRSRDSYVVGANTPATKPAKGKK